MKLELDDLIDQRLLPLVAESRDFYASRTSSRGPGSWDELRAFREKRISPALSQPPAAEEVASVAGRSVSLRIHTPRHWPATAILLDIHGGGFYWGSAADNDIRNRQLSDALGAAIVSVDYRLAPEHPWPAAPDDCEAAALWLAEQAELRFGTSRAAISGFSAGANLAMSTLLRLRDRGIGVFAAAVLQSGIYDLSTQTPAGRMIADEYFVRAYAETAPDRTHPDLSPIFADFAGLPPVLMVIGEDDTLLHDNLALAARMMATGGFVDLRLYPGSPHGFVAHPTAMARAAMDDITAWLKDLLRPTQKRACP
ncbi:MAG TPA: alpha/beta hydrolase [Mycobacteriales bacterium]|nr:alpha/beta hydrolase [Mycobacteriales bacterium]